MRKKRRGGISSGIVGLAMGLILGLLIVGQRDSSSSTITTIKQINNSSAEAVVVEKEDVEEDIDEAGLLYVGVMTASKYLETRARAVRETWGKEVPGRLSFYSSWGSKSTSLKGQLVGLERVDDSYPPQKKSFLMLQHMWQKFGQRYEWFLRADDDVYVRMDKLEKLLRSLDSRRAHYIGQAGRGNSKEFGLLSLEYDENFCMGGPGVLLSRETLKRIVPHIKTCLGNLYTHHEDVELGRCVRKFAGVACTWNYEMQSILYHNSSGEMAFTGSLKSKQVHRAISLHPVKSTPHMYRLHNYMRGLKIQDLQQSRLLLQDDISSSIRIGQAEVNGPQLLGHRPSESRHWDFISRSEYSLGETNPRRRVRGDAREGLEDATREVMAAINACSRQRGRMVEERQALYGYRSLRPRLGSLTVLDLLLMYRKYRGRKLSLPVRRHLYLRQRFASLEMRQVEDAKVTVNLVLPVWGRGEALRRFLDNYEGVCLSEKNERVRLLLVHYPGGDNDWPGLESRLNELQRTHGSKVLRLVRGEGRFSRARALEQGLDLLESSDLALLIDVDIRLGKGALDRARRNALLGRRLYFPVVFSQYSPEMRPPANDQDELRERAGFWRQFGFGIAALYKADYEAIGKFDVKIEGWGHEDVDLYEKAVRSPLQIFRAADPHLVHVYHGVHCPSQLTAQQLAMCRGTRADTYAAAEQLAELLYREPKYLRYINSTSTPAA